MPLCPVHALRPAPAAAKSAATLQGLPEELKLHILQQSGPNPYTMLAMQQVNKQWSRIAQDDSLWTPLCPNDVSEVGIPPPPMLPPPTPQARFGAYMRSQNTSLRRAVRQLWHAPEPLETMTHASCDPVFVCHATLALPEPGKAPWRWSPLHAANQAKRRSQNGIACQG